MANHRAEDILAAVKAKLIAANTDAGAKVERGKNDQYVDSDFNNNTAALNVLMGSDSPQSSAGFMNLAFMDSELQVYVEMHISAPFTPIPETALNQLRKQVHAALMADRTLGLSYVTSIVPNGAAEPSYNGDHEFIMHKQRTAWRVLYRSSISDPSA